MLQVSSRQDMESETQLLHKKLHNKWLQRIVNQQKCGEKCECHRIYIKQKSNCVAWDQTVSAGQREPDYGAKQAVKGGPDLRFTLHTPSEK